MADDKTRAIALVAVLVAAGGGYFLFQQYRERAAVQDRRARSVATSEARLVSDYSRRPVPTMTAAAGDMKREVRRYLDSLNNPKANLSGKVVTDSMEKFMTQLVTLQGIGSDLAPMIDLTFESCPTPKSSGSSFEAGFEASVAELNAK